MLLVQKFLENHTFKQLQELHGVYASFSKSGHKFSLNYDMIESKESDLLAQECRGLILACEDGKPIFQQILQDGKMTRDSIEPGKTKIIAYPLKRFFNHGQGSAAEIDWADPNLSVMDKLDGTLCIVYFDTFTLQWCVATRSVPEADIPLDVSNFTFRTLFEKAVKDTLYLDFETFCSHLNTLRTYCFELTSPYNTIVCRYQTCGITLLAVRDIFTLQELDINQEWGNLPKVGAYPLNNINDIINFVASLNPLQNEGVVVKDSKYNRIKVKNPSYVMFSRAKESICNDRAFLSLILSEKEDDVIEILPIEIKNRILELKVKINYFSNKISDQYDYMLANSSSKKEFALLIQKNKIWGAPLFEMYDKKCINFKGFIEKNKNKIDKSFSNSFLDKLLELI